MKKKRFVYAEKVAPNGTQFKIQEGDIK